MVLEKTLESSLDWKEIQQIHPKGDQSWVLIGRTDVEAKTPIFWPPDMKRLLIWGIFPNPGMEPESLNGSFIGRWVLYP